MQNQSQRLDNFSKLLLATGQLNFFASSLNDLNMTMRGIVSSSNDEHLLSRLNDNDKQIEFLLEEVTKALENLHDYMNGIDAVSEIDMRISKVPNEILIFEQDEIDESYAKVD